MEPFDEDEDVAEKPGRGNNNNNQYDDDFKSVLARLDQLER